MFFIQNLSGYDDMGGMSMENRQCPFGYVVGILLKQLAICHTEQKAGFGVIYRIVVNIDAVGQGCTAHAIDY